MHNRILSLRARRLRTALSLLLCALLLALPASAAAGEADDPLISRSYAEETFLPQLSEELRARAEDCLAARAAAAAPAQPGMETRVLAAGDSVTLRDGQQLVLLSGGVRLEIAAGKLVNATLGRASSGGDARVGHRYLAWGGAEVVAACAEGATVCVSASAEGKTAPKPAPECPFDDVPETAWYYGNVSRAYARGLVNGMTPTAFAPQGQLTLAQAMKLAACMRQLYTEGAVTLENGEPWYLSYARYALDSGIIEAIPDGGWDDAIDRAGFVRLFYAALPEDAYAPINTIMDGAIPDVPTDAAVAREVYAFYAAGILTGYTADETHLAGAFDPAGRISRAEVAAIMDRMFDPASRVRFDMD